MNNRSDHQRGIPGRIVGAILSAVACLLVVAAPLRAAEPGAVIVLTATRDGESRHFRFVLDVDGGSQTSGTTAVRANEGKQKADVV